MNECQVFAGWLLRAPTCTPARSAAVAGSATHHQRTADIADGRISHLDHVAERSNRIFTLEINCRLNRYWNRSEQLTLFASNKFQFQPAEDVINEGLGVANLGIAGPTAGLEARVRELAA